MTHLSLHCFKGQPQAMAIILFADYLDIKLNIKILKPINIKEKQYKSTVLKQFPLLEISNGVFIENTGAILRYLARQNQNGQSIYNETNESCNLIDQNLDYFLSEIVPSFYAFLAVNRNIIEIQSKDLALIKKDVCANLKALDVLLSTTLDQSLNLFDFVVFSSINLVDKDMNKLVKNLKSLQKRWSVVEKDEKFKRMFQNNVRVLTN